MSVLLDVCYGVGFYNDHLCAVRLTEGDVNTSNVSLSLCLSLSLSLSLSLCLSVSLSLCPLSLCLCLSLSLSLFNLLKYIRAKLETVLYNY